MFLNSPQPFHCRAISDNITKVPRPVLFYPKALLVHIATLFSRTHIPRQLVSWRLCFSSRGRHDVSSTSKLSHSHSCTKTHTHTHFLSISSSACRERTRTPIYQVASHALHHRCRHAHEAVTWIRSKTPTQPRLPSTPTTPTEGGCLHHKTSIGMRPRIDNERSVNQSQYMAPV